MAMASTAPPASMPLRGQLARFAAVGGLCTVIQLGLFAVLDQLMPGQAANLVSLVLSTIVNTTLNRRWTFAVSGRGAFAQQAQAFAVFLLTWGATAGGLGLLDELWPDASTAVRVVALALATGLSTVVRFVAMRRWIFARA